MINLPASDVKGNLSDALDKVATGSEHLAIQRPGKESVYIISAQDYKLFLRLLEEAEDHDDLQEAESRIASADGDFIEFDDFFADLGV